MLECCRMHAQSQDWEHDWEHDLHAFVVCNLPACYRLMPKHGWLTYTQQRRAAGHPRACHAVPRSSSYQARDGISISA